MSIAKTSSTSTINFSRPPIDYEAIIRQVIESNINPVRTIVEYLENAIDAKATRIDIEVMGNVFNDKVEVTGIKITDDGEGMSENTFARNFRGIGWHNPNTHDNVNRYGKNCIGAKSGLDYFKYIDVVTTTQGYIEDFTDPELCDDEMEKQLVSEIIAVHDRYSNLNPGDPDTETRRYRMEMLETEVLEPWESCDHAKKGTTVHLHTPVSGRNIIIEIDELKKNLSFHFEWISKMISLNEQEGEHSKRRKKGLFLKLPGSRYETIMPFDNGWSANNYTTSNPKGSYLLVTGSLKNGVKFEYINSEGMLTKVKGIKDFVQPINLNEKEKKSFNLDIGDVEIWLQLTYGMDNRDKQLLTSISGSTLSKLPWELHNKISHGGGLSSAIRGKIVSHNPHLKNSLRHNRTELDMGDALVLKFWNYIYKDIMGTMADYYKNFMEESNQVRDGSLYSEALSSLNFLFSGKEPQERNPQTKVRWVCSICNHVFLYDMKKRPLSCPECGARNLVPYSHIKSNTNKTERGSSPSTSGTPDYNLVDSLGHFIPMRYNGHEHKFEIASNHPEFTSEFTTIAKWSSIFKERLVKHALVAWTAYQMDLSGKDGESFLREYGKLLKGNFLKDYKRKKAVEKRWAEITDIKLFVDRESSSFE